MSAADIIDVTVYLRDRMPLALACPRDDPVLDQLLDALAQSRDPHAADDKLLYLELEDETVYIPLSQLVAVETGASVAGNHSPAPVSGPGGRSVAILVLGCLLQRYETCLDVIQRTWASRRFTDIDVYYAFGAHFDPAEVSAHSVEKYIGHEAPVLDNFGVRYEGNVIVCGCADTFQMQNDSLLRKRLIAFRHLADTGRYDFVYTVCASSYVDQACLRTYVESVDEEMLFHGPIGVCEFTGRPYVSGASMLFSMDMIERLVADTRRIIDDNADRHADDVALSSWIARNFSDTPQERIVENIHAERRATGDNTFVLPGSVGMINYVHTEPARQVPVEGMYHYHFDSATIGHMAEFHRRFFKQERRYGSSNS